MRSVQKGGRVILEQQFMNGELRMRTYDEIRLDARVFFLHRSLNIVSPYSYYFKFPVSSKITGVGPDEPVRKP